MRMIVVESRWRPLAETPFRSAHEKAYHNSAGRYWQKEWSNAGGMRYLRMESKFTKLPQLQEDT